MWGLVLVDLVNNTLQTDKDINMTIKTRFKIIWDNGLIDFKDRIPTNKTEITSIHRCTTQVDVFGPIGDKIQFDDVQIYPSVNLDKI